MFDKEITEAITALFTASTLLTKIKHKLAEYERSGLIGIPAEKYLDLIMNNERRCASTIEDLQFNSEKNRLFFTDKEVKDMSKDFRRAFATGDIIIFYRRRKNGVLEARYRGNGYNIAVSSKDLTVLKQKFIKALNGEQVAREQKNNVQRVIFSEYAESWLNTKRRTTKPTTYSEYERLVRYNLEPLFGNRELRTITREEIQTYLFSVIDEGKKRTAEKLHLVLRCLFDLAAEDFDIKSPMKRIVLPFYESKKGSALTREEEKALVAFCERNVEAAASSALLVLLFFGLRRSELKTIRIEGESLICVSSKTLLGRNEVERRIPFTPAFRRVLPYIDFVKAKNVNVHTIQTTFKKVLPNHHPHELRYTFITRCKECGVNPEIVMLWDGHEEDKDVKSSKIDRGYTDFSWEFQLKEAEKVDYN